MTMAIGLMLQPLDLLMFHEGRPFGPADIAVSSLPRPQTLAGMLRTQLLVSLGADLPRLGDAMKSGASFAESCSNGQPDGIAAIGTLQVRGPWLARRTDSGPHEVLVPCPANLFAESKDSTGPFHRRDPLRSRELPGWQPQEEGFFPLAVAGPEPKRSKRPTRFLTAAGLKRYLEGGIPEEEELLPRDDLYFSDRRTGIAIQPDQQTVEAGLIYGAQFLVLNKGICFYAELVGNEALLEHFKTHQLMHWGGEGRAVTAECIPPYGWPAAAAPATGEGRLLLLTTPGLFGGWRPPGLPLCAAAVPAPEAVSGWDLARRQPKPMRYAAPAGSVYFLQDGAGSPDSTSLVADPDTAALGWGCYLEGRFRYV